MVAHAHQLVNYGATKVRGIIRLHHTITLVQY